LPEPIAKAFEEGATCLAVKAYSAAGTLFRQCLDLPTAPLLPLRDGGNTPQPSEKERRDLGLRLVWLFDNGLLPESFRELAKWVREDGNDGADAGTPLQVDAGDLLDFTYALLDCLISEKARIAKAQERRQARRDIKKPRVLRRDSVWTNRNRIRKSVAG